MAEEPKNGYDMSPNERMAWLRERGVLVETAEERKQRAVASAMREADRLDTEIAYVLVPADSSKPLQEFCFKPFRGVAGDLLINHLKPAFTKKSGEHVDIELLKQQTSQTLTGSADTPSTVSDSTLQQVASEANVEVFTLVHPTPSNNFTSINIYLDEVGMLKRLPLNTRASAYAERAGFNPPPTFYGDVFLGRVKQNPAIQNISFRLGPDTASDALWLQAATTQNLEHQMKMNQITGRGDEQQPGVAGGDGKAKQEDGYTWTQTEQELELVVLLPLDAASKDVSVKFRPQSVQIFYQKDNKADLHLFERIEVDGSTWTLEKQSTNTRLVVTMEKLEEALWPRICD